MPENDNHQLTQLHQQIREHFILEEVRTLCLHLGVDYDDLGGEGKSDKIRELILRLERKGRLADLLAEVKAAQPQLSSIQNLLPPPYIPYRRNELFTGREEWLTQLHDALNRDEPVAVTQAVAGLGGVGKTQLALAYCYRHLDEYDLIQWLRADDVTTLSTALAELATRLGLARRSVTDQPALHQLALNWLHTTDKHWLLVYDNADAIQPKELRPFLPKLGHGACLITSRNPSWGTLAQTLNLTHFSDGEAVAFLLGQPAMTSEAIAAHPQGEDALKLAHLLGHLPLALEHARAYVEETGCSLADYADYFENEREELWGGDLPAPANYDEKTITTTWELAFAQVRQTPGAAALLNLCCFLAPDEIPLNLIMAAVGAVREPPLPEELVALANSNMKLDKAIAALRRYSLLTRDGDTIALHRLVQTVARDQMPEETLEVWLKAAIYLIETVFPAEHNMLHVWEEGQVLLPHIIQVIEQAKNYELLPETTAYLCSWAGFYLNFLGSYGAARPFYESAVELNRTHLGEDHTETAISLNNLGLLLKTLGEYEAARPYYERALEIREKTLGENHPDTATTLNDLANLLKAIGKYDEAKPYFERALEVYEAALGPNHPWVAVALSNLATLLQAEGAYEAARPYLERALEIGEKTLGPDHPKVALRLNNLGQLLQAEGAYEAARPYLERAIEIGEKTLGKDHPEVAVWYNNLASLLQDVGAYEAARPYLERALAIDEKALGPDHPDVAIDLNNLGMLMQTTGDLESAKRYLERALQIKEKSLPPNHPSTIIGRDNLAALLAEIEGKS